MRRGAARVSREASPDPELTQRLNAARLYVITPDASAERVIEVATAAARGGADIVQLRHKTMPRGELLTLARNLREALSGVLFIVNDYVDIALLSGADGVHLGPADITVASARKAAGGRLVIGVSASTPDGVQDGADYVGCGPAFATPLKPQKKVIGPQGVAAMNKAMTIPVFAIGGIDESNIQELTVLGVRRACVVRAVSDARDPESSARRLRAMLAP